MFKETKGCVCVCRRTKAHTEHEKSSNIYHIFSCFVLRTCELTSLLLVQRSHENTAMPAFALALRVCMRVHAFTCVGVRCERMRVCAQLYDSHHRACVSLHECVVQYRAACGPSLEERDGSPIWPRVVRRVEATGVAGTAAQLCLQPRREVATAQRRLHPPQQLDRPQVHACASFRAQSRTRSYVHHPANM